MPTRTEDTTTETITPDTPDVWRFVCPRGHTSWDRTNGGWWCKYCADAAIHNPDVDPEFDYLYDKQTGRQLSRDEVEYERIPL